MAVAGDPVIALDVTAAVVGNTGVARYANRLPDALEQLGLEVHRFAIGGRRVSDPRIRHRRIPIRVAQQLWRTGHPTAEALLGRRPDLVHSLDLVPPPTRARTLVTIHDVGALERPDLHSSETIEAARRQLAVAMSVDLVCAGSETTKRALVSRGVPAERIRVTRYGVTDLPTATAPPIREPGYILMVGMVTPRKGYDVVVRAMEQLPDQRLVLVGPDGWRSQDTTDLIARSPARSRIERPGFVSDTELGVLLRDAGCQVMPSRLEGFGIPLLEAMARKVPMVCADIGSLREVGGDVPFFVPVDDVEATAQGIREALAEPHASERMDRGAAEAATFTWDRVARDTAAAYEEVLGRPLLGG